MREHLKEEEDTIDTEARVRGHFARPLAHNRSFLLLWAGQFISQMGDRLAMVALPWLVYDSTGSAIGTGAVLALYTVPYVLLGALAGVALDRFNKRTLMVFADLSRAVLVLLVPFAAQWSLPLVYVLTFLIASAAVLFDPGKLALLPEVVGKDGLMRANSLLAVSENITEIVGYAFAGVMLAYLSTTASFRIDAASFCVSAVALLLMRYSRQASAAVSKVKTSLWLEIREGVIYLRRHRGLFVNTCMVVASMAGMGASYPLTFLFAVDVLAGGTKAFGLLEATMALGYLVGSVVLATLANKVPKGWAMSVGLCSMGCCLVAVALTENVFQAVIPFALFGFSNAAALIAVDTYLQEAIPDPLRGRVFGIRFTLTQGTWALSVLAGGVLASYVSIPALFVVAGLVVAIPALFGLSVPEIRKA